MWYIKEVSLKRNIVLIFLPFILCLSLLQAAEECTTAVFAGKATVDGRPLLWKNRDTSDENNEVVFISGGTYDVLALINAGQTDSGRKSGGHLHRRSAKQCRNKAEIDKSCQFR